MAIALILAYALAQIGGCHYYINAVPRIIISSEPIDITEQTQNKGQPQ